MYRLLPLLGDVGLSILSVFFVASLYNSDARDVFWLLPLALAPDLDALSEVFKRGKVAASAVNPHDHREALHHPILWLVPLGLCWWVFGYYGAAAFTLILVHFLHDSVLTGWGVPWLSPWSKVRVKFFVNNKNEVSFARGDWIRVWREDELTKLIVAYGNENWIEDIYLRPTLVSVIEYGIFITAVCLLFIL